MYRSLARLGLFFSMASLVPVLGAGQISPDLQDLLSLKPGKPWMPSPRWRCSIPCWPSTRNCTGNVCRARRRR